MSYVIAPKQDHFPFYVHVTFYAENGLAVDFANFLDENSAKEFASLKVIGNKA